MHNEPGTELTCKAARRTLGHLNMLPVRGGLFACFTSQLALCIRLATAACSLFPFHFPSLWFIPSGNANEQLMQHGAYFRCSSEFRRSTSGRSLLEEDAPMDDEGEEGMIIHRDSIPHLILTPYPYQYRM